MDLMYRGTAYRTPPESVSGIETGLKACFRGVTYSLMATRCDRPRAGFTYQFRGVSYRNI